MNEEKVNNFKDAERAAEKWASVKHQKIKDLAFDKIWREGNIWTIEGSVRLGQGILGLSRVSKFFKLQLLAQSGEVIGYQV